MGSRISIYQRRETHVQDASTSSILSEAATVVGSPQASSFINGTAKPTGVFPVIPPTHRSRTLILCFDGTGDQFDNDNSNIVEFFTMLKKDNRDEQMVYYQAGIGTYTSTTAVTPLASKFSKVLDEAVAWNLSAHVTDGYEFLMQNYKAGDRICIFGFSRGAYTARGLAGMIHKIGLLPACNHQQIPFAYKMYTRVDELGWSQSNAFKKAFSVDVDIEFIGVWDTVNSVGLIPRRLPFTTSNTIVRTFRHAVSLDERRAKFKANLWNRPTSKEAVMGIQGQKPQVAGVEATSSADAGTPAPPGTDASAVHKAKKRGEGLPLEREASLRAMENKYGGKSDRPTDIEEVWFAGCHCDVGGGSVTNDTPNSLARIALRWMIRECFKADTGIMFMSDDLRNIGLDPAALYPYVQARPPHLPVNNAHLQTIPKTLPKTHYGDVDDLVKIYKSEEEHELLDAMSPIYDQLSLAKFWWILELLPIKQRYQKSDSTGWVKSTGMNLGRGRIIPGQKKKVVKVHRSVKMRMEAQYEDGTKYVPKASFDTALSLGRLQWVD